MEFNDCFTWSDLDKGHQLKLVSEKLLEEMPYLRNKVSVGSVFEVVKIYSDETGNNTIVKGKGIEMVLKRHMIYYFLWKY